LKSVVIEIFINYEWMSLKALLLFVCLL